MDCSASLTVMPTRNALLPMMVAIHHANLPMSSMAITQDVPLQLPSLSLHTNYHQILHSRQAVTPQMLPSVVRPALMEIPTIL